jgi:hypothetical protein
MYFKVLRKIYRINLDRNEEATQYTNKSMLASKKQILVKLVGFIIIGACYGNKLNFK